MNIKLGIYSKQLAFFLVVGAVGILGYYFFSNQEIFGSISDVMEIDYSRSSYVLNMDVDQDSSVLVANTEDNSVIQPKKDYDLFKYVVYSKEGLYLSNLDVYVTLPSDVDDFSQLQPRIYAVHGVVDSEYEVVNDRTIMFHAEGLSPSATFTVEMRFPKGYIDIPWTKQLVLFLDTAGIYFWMIVGIVPLILTMVVLWIVSVKIKSEHSEIKVSGFSEELPDNLTPAEASVIVNRKLNSRAIAATLIDLANRGKVRIIDHDEYFSFAKTNNIQGNLTEFEKVLLEEIFIDEKKQMNTSDVEMKIAKHIFSKRIAQVYLAVYYNLFKKDYFDKDPNKFQGKYKKIGCGLFALGFLGFIASMYFFIEVPYVLILWFGIMAGAMFIVKMSPKVPAKTEFGEKKALEWAKFKNFLTNKEEYGYSFEAQLVYEKYLPYAVAFGCEREWSKRFLKHPFRMPNWLITTKNAVVIEDILDEIVPFVTYIGYKLAQIKEPTV